ncbi:hypothetical protein INR49_010035 [Caranx melampygus]|nr:hypothetical protein INR49_010035 [Caranx melampygus]
MIASEIFKDKKDNYPQSVPKLFVSTRLSKAQVFFCQTSETSPYGEDINPKVLQTLGSEKMKYAVPVTKYDRKGYKARPRQLLLTGNSAVIVEEAKLKQRIEYGALKELLVAKAKNGHLSVLNSVKSFHATVAFNFLNHRHLTERVTRPRPMTERFLLVALGDEADHQTPSTRSPPLCILTVCGATVTVLNQQVFPLDHVNPPLLCCTSRNHKLGMKLELSHGPMRRRGCLCIALRCYKAVAAAMRDERRNIESKKSDRLHHPSCERTPPPPPPPSPPLLLLLRVFTRTETPGPADP